MLALVIAALVAFCGHRGRQSAQRQTALPGFVPTLMARASPEVDYLLGTAWGASPRGMSCCGAPMTAGTSKS